MPDRVAIPILLAVLFILCGAGVLCIGGLVLADESEGGEAGKERDEPSPLDKHLTAEAERLAADPDAIEQKDARWIAEQLGDEPTAGDLRELFNQRYRKMYEEYTERLKKEYPDLYHSTAAAKKRVTGTNGYTALEKQSEFLEELSGHPDHKPFMAPGFDENASTAESRAAFMEATERVASALKEADSADVIVYVPPRSEKWSELGLTPALYPAVKCSVSRIRIHALNDDYPAAVTELTVLLSVLSRFDSSGTTLTALYRLVGSEIVLNQAVLKLVDNEEVSVEILAQWLHLGRETQPDIMKVFACEFAESMRLSVEAKDFEDYDYSTFLKNGDEFESVEDCFADRRRYAEGRFAVMEYATRPHLPVHTPEGLEAVAHLDQDTGVWMTPNVRDAAKSYWRWLELELRIFAREHALLADHKDEVEAIVAAHRPLEAKWVAGILEVRVGEAPVFGKGEDKPLFIIEP